MTGKNLNEGPVLIAVTGNKMLELRSAQVNQSIQGYMKSQGFVLVARIFVMFVSVVSDVG